MTFDTIIRGGTVATASDTFSCDIGIKDGRIAALGADLGAARDTVDASGKLVLPGSSIRVKIWWDKSQQLPPSD